MWRMPCPEEAASDRRTRRGPPARRRFDARTKEARMAEETTETPVLDLLAKMTADSIEATSLDAETLMLVRLAALIAVDAAPASYLMNLGVATELGVDSESAQDVLLAVAPIVGTTRIVSAAGKMVRALGLAIAIADAIAEDEELEED
jgi:4-carboxymuconolactone decarboxylase